MAALVKLLALFLLTVFAQSLPLERLELSDLEVGVKGPNDTLLFLQITNLKPQPNMTFEKIRIGMSNEFVLINYISVIESGGFTSARANVSEGGPGYSFVVVDLIPGPPQSFNYTTEVYGEELEQYKHSDSVYRKSMYEYFE